MRLAEQRFDIASGRLAAGLAKNAAAHERDLVRVGSRLSPLLLQRPQQVQKERLDRLVVRLQPAAQRGLDRAAERLLGLSKLYVSVDPDRPLQRGFARVSREDGSLVMNGGLLASGEEVSITFGDKVVRQAVIEGDPGAAPTLARRPARKGKAPAADQGDLF
jgi:exodeoxyribonuclease VII large subunit